MEKSHNITNYVVAIICILLMVLIVGFVQTSVSSQDATNKAGLAYQIEQQTHPYKQYVLNDPKETYRYMGK